MFVGAVYNGFFFFKELKSMTSGTVGKANMQ